MAAALLASHLNFRALGDTANLITIGLPDRTRRSPRFFQRSWPSAVRPVLKSGEGNDGFQKLWPSR